jgi:hypothetical protein
VTTAVDVVFHFSEDPTITEFIPRVAKTAVDHRPLVWAVGCGPGS